MASRAAGVKLIIVAMACAVAGAAPSPARADVERHSGTVVAFDPSSRTLVLGEVGPWKVQDAGTVVTRVAIALGPASAVTAVARAEGAAPSGWLGDFVETPSSETALRRGDHVTVTVRRDGGALTAESVTVVGRAP